MDKDYTKISEIFKALAHPIRLKILMGLRQHQDCNVSLMAEKLDIPQSTVSQHLSMMRSRGIISPIKNGTKTCYQVTRPLVIHVLDILNSDDSNMTKTEE